jgi:hypothetical protein
MAATRRHAYLPGLAAFDKNHSKAALKEIRYAGPNNEYTPGSVFVDSQEARNAVFEQYDNKFTKVWDKLRAGNLAPARLQHLRSKAAFLKATMQNIQVVNPNAAGFNNQAARAPDLLFVKGHGSATNPHSISTESAPVETAVPWPAGPEFQHPTTVRIKRGFKVDHTALEIGDTVQHIANAVNSPGLDVRITSCGSAGTVSREFSSVLPRNMAETFAGQVSARLDSQHADPRIRVSGFQGDTNATFPTANAPGDGFTTKIKQKADSDNRFFDAIERQTAKLGPLTERSVPRKRPLQNPQLEQQIHQLMPAPSIGAMAFSPALAQRVRTFNKIQVSDAVDRERVAIGPRANALITVNRN